MFIITAAEQKIEDYINIVRIKINLYAKTTNIILCDP